LPATGGRITYGDASNAQDLKNYAVYVIPECYRTFTTAEKQAIVAFVQAGGGLYMMGNHEGAARVTSQHPGSTDAFHVFNDLLANEASGFGFTFVVGHGPGDSNANTTSTAITPGSGPIEQALVHGANGLMTAMDFHSYAYINLTGSNPATKWIVQTQVSGDSSADYFVVATTYGSGRVVAIGDSAPSDDGTTTTSGKSLHGDYTLNSNRAFLLNAVDWLASGSASSGSNTVTASITTPSGNVTLASGASQSFAGSATDSSSSATLSYSWNFGDGSTATGATASHVFTNTGSSAITRTVTFTAKDSTGASDSATRTVTVNPAAAGGGAFAEVEPNNGISSANAVSPAFNAITGHLTSSSDVDYFALSLQPGQKLSIAMTGPSGVDWDLYLKSSSGSTLTSSLGGTAHESLSYTNSGSSAITVYPEVTVYSGTSATNYTLALTYSGGGSGGGTGSSLSETFDSGSKGAYADGSVSLSSGSWDLNDALLASSSSDPHDGAQAVRVRNTGMVTMSFNFAGGAKTVTLKHAKYGSDGSSTWGLWYSTNGGSSWTQAGSSVTTSSSTLSTATFTVNVSGAIRFQIRKTSGGSNRVDFDDFQIAGY
ncbi:MAG TPA: PKD domain-containing protein, partial [Holophagaceae bacterium]|nr:PKD domain-containing protein [Holophagaceae bacterium]